MDTEIVWCLVIKFHQALKHKFFKYVEFWIPKKYSKNQFENHRIRGTFFLLKNLQDLITNWILPSKKIVKWNNRMFCLGRLGAWWLFQVSTPSSCWEEVTSARDLLGGREEEKAGKGFRPWCRANTFESIEGRKEDRRGKASGISTPLQKPWLVQQGALVQWL